MIYNHFLLSQLANWYETPLGAKLFAAEQAHLNTLLPTLFGYHLLNLSLVKQQFSFTASPIRHQIHIKRPQCITEQTALVKGSNLELPFSSNSIDLVILSHVCEFVAEPHLVIEEACRVVIPEGHILIFGFNPFSSWGLRSLCHRRGVKMPWAGHFIDRKTIVKQLARSDFATVQETTLFPHFPITHAGWAERLAWLECVSHWLLPFSGAVYSCLAKKEVESITTIRSPWRRRKLRETSAIIEPTNRRAN